MFIRAHDGGADEDTWRAFVRKQGFGHLAVSGDGAVPVVVPTQFVLRDDEVVLHLAKPNPVFTAVEATPHAVLSVAGDWAYIPGAWRQIGDEDPTLGIPTTYYGAVQIIGEVSVVDDPDELAEILRIQLADTEPADSELQDPTAHLRRFPAIRGVRLAIDEVRTKFKYGANVDEAHRAAIVDRLSARGGPGDDAAAARIPRG